MPESEPSRRVANPAACAGPPCRCERVQGHSYGLDQEEQVAILTDFCNECGNCATFCPTAGRPYADKPRLYLRRAEAEAEAEELAQEAFVRAYFALRTYKPQYKFSTWLFKIATNLCINHLKKGICKNGACNRLILCLYSNS